MIQRSANKSSTSRKPQRKPEIEPDRVLDEFGQKAIAAIADFDHRGWYGYRSVTASRHRRDKAAS